MQILKTFFLTLKSNIVNILMYLGIFVVLLVLFTSNGSEAMNAFQEDSMNILIEDSDNSVLSKSLCDFLDTTHNVTVSEEKVENITDKLYFQTIDYVLIIPNGFETKLKQGKYHDVVENIQLPDSMTGFYIDAQIEQYLNILSSCLIGGYDTKQAAETALKTSAKKAEVTMLHESQAENESIFYFYSYLPYVITCMIILGLGLVLCTFRKTEIDTRIQCSSTSVLSRNLSLILGSVIFSASCWIVYIIIGFALAPENFFGKSGMLYLCNSLVYLLFTMGLAFFVSFLTSSSSMLNVFSNILALGLSFLGGIFVPMEYMSKSVLKLSRLLPSYWYVTAMDAAQKYATDSSQLDRYLSCIGIEALFAIAILAAALALSRYRKALR